MGRHRLHQRWSNFEVGSPSADIGFLCTYPPADPENLKIVREFHQAAAIGILRFLVKLGMNRKIPKTEFLLKQFFIKLDGLTIVIFDDCFQASNRAPY